MCNKLPFHNKPTIFNKFPVYNIHSDSHSGCILIEFAFSIPILIILLLFACDHYRFYELKDKIKTSAYLATSMLQQLGNTRTDKQLTSTDCAHIAFASCLNFFHTNSMFEPSPFGIMYVAHFYYVKRINNNSYQYQKCFGATQNATSVQTMNKYCSSVTQKTLAKIQSLHPDLVCNKDGEERVLIECVYRAARNYKSKRQLGFFLLEPRTIRSTLDNSDNFFSYCIVITPKPGILPCKSN